jgi:U1 small nuclear ribonucleoprotein
MSAIGLPVNILAHFVPRPPVAYSRPAPPPKLPRYGPMSSYIRLFETEPSSSLPPIPEPPSERKKRSMEERIARHLTFLSEQRELYNPIQDANAISDPYKTLFVGRLAFETTERTLKRVFEEWGPVKTVKLVLNKDGKSRGYAFIEYETERDLRNAYKQADGIKIDGREVLVDVERGRTVPGWFPRRLGGGRGPGRDGRLPSKRKRPLQKSTNNFRSRGERSRVSPPRDNHPRAKFARDRRDTSRRSSFNY